jgi:hypothetical protein
MNPPSSKSKHPLRVLLLNQTFHPDVMATAQYLTELAVELKSRGHTVTVVTSRRAYDQPDKIFPANETWRGIHIHRIWSSRFGKLAKWRRAADFATFILSCCWRLLWLPRQDVTVALTSPPLISWIAAWFTRLRGGTFCYWVMDLNPDEAVAAGWLRQGSVVQRVLESFSRFSVHTAARIVVLDRFMAQRVRNKEVREPRISIISLWQQDEQVRFDAAGRAAFRQQHGLGDAFVVMHAGNHSPCHPLDTVMQAAELLRSEPGIRFCFQGGGSEFRRVQAFAHERQLTNIICLPYQPVAQLAGALSAADAHIVVMGEPFVGTIHPCKIYNALAVGAPIVYVGPAESHVTDLLASCASAPPQVQVRHGEGQKLAAALRQLATAKRRLSSAECQHFAAQCARNVLLPRLVAAVEECQPGATSA